jgi:hypothetical protein
MYRSCVFDVFIFTTENIHIVGEDFDNILTHSIQKKI